jgi:hypothetical protein
VLRAVVLYPFFHVIPGVIVQDNILEIVTVTVVIKVSEECLLEMLRSVHAGGEE